ncbi:MAG: hypothetical protein P1P77_07675 [Spirochaetaceae bacterium]|nr:hypothetical protein [Spirochaetaceae bacterium]
MMRTDSLIPAKGENQFFSDYAKGWWDWDTCEYLAYRRTRRRITRSYADTAALNLRKHILPYFGKKRLKEINVYQIERWMVSLQEKGYMNAAINSCLGFFRVMLGFAVHKGD